jgi:hypothetical protein
MQMTIYSLLDVLGSDFGDDDEGAPTLIKNSPYYTNDDAVTLLKTRPDALSLLSLNCQSLPSKFSQLQIYTEFFKQNSCPFSIISLQETWLSNDYDTSLLQLDGYDFIHMPRQCSLHGGVGIYIKNTLKYQVLQIEGNPELWDGIFIEITLKCKNPGKKLILGNIYRPPRDNLENYCLFNEDLEEILERFSHSNSEVVITGDFNFDLLKMKEKEHVNTFFDTLCSNGLFPKITQPTRITENSKTLIDNCFMKVSANFSGTISGILQQNISDHQPYFVTLDNLDRNIQNSKYLKIMKMNSDAQLSFKNDLAKTCSLQNFETGNYDDPNKNNDILDTILKTAMDKHMPVKYIKYRKHKHKKCNWITSGIIRSIKFRDSLYKRCRATAMDDPLYNTLKINLQTYNRILKQSIRRAKTEYYQSCFEKYKDDTKNTWNTIKTIINKDHVKSNFPETFIINNTRESCPKKIADAFNEYFVQIGPKLANSIQNPASNISHREYLQRSITTRFQFKNVSVTDVQKIIKELKPKSSYGKDRLSNNLLKFISPEISPALTLIINQSLNTGIFPESLKIAKVLPIHKKDVNDVFTNYRPISILSSVSKVFERVIHDQLCQYFTVNNLLFDRQYGFRSKHSTEMASLEIIDRIVCNMDKNKIPLNIFLDLSKAFDTLDHDILLDKLKYYGLSGRNLDLMKSYLCNRKQYVAFKDSFSNLLTIETGVPQGSILGPLLFIIYLNDFANACNVFKPVIYADDTALFATLEAFATDFDFLQTNITHELKTINMWFMINKLSLNKDKTKAMMFHTAQRQVRNININLDDANIEILSEFNYLGINFDSNLTWKSHISKVSKKVSRTIGVMTKLKKYLPTHILKTLYNSLIFPHLHYGILVWGNSANKLIKLQKKAIRVVANAKYNDHTQPLFKKLGLLTITDILRLQDLKFLYKLENGSLPTYFKSAMFIRQSHIHNYTTRQTCDFRIPQYKHTFVLNSPRFRLPSVFNNCPPNIKEKVLTHSYSGFTKYIKHVMISNYETTCSIRNCYICNRI